MNRWKIILAAALIFLAGAASGACGLYLFHAMGPPQANSRLTTSRLGPGSGPKAEFLRRATMRLDLSPVQREKIDELVSASQQRMRKLWEPVAPQAHAEMEGLQKSIEEVLTSEQKSRFAKLLSERATSQGNPGQNPRRRERGEWPESGPGATNREANPSRDPSPGH